MRNRKIGLFIFFMSVTVSMTACTRTQGTSASSGSQSDKSSVSSTSKVDAASSGNQGTSNSTSTQSGKSINSMYFFNGTSKQTYRGTFLFDDEIEKDVTLNIIKVAELKDGVLYSLKIDPVDGVPSDRLDLGYYYVLQNQIYKIDQQNNHISELENSGSIPDGSAIVCQENELKDSLGSTTQGWHQSIEVIGDKRLYQSFNDNIESGYYENIIWQSKKGIVEYQSGFGADKNSMDLKIE